jgi:hypothetical protein
MVKREMQANSIEKSERKIQLLRPRRRQIALRVYYNYENQVADA